MFSTGPDRVSISILIPCLSMPTQGCGSQMFLSESIETAPNLITTCLLNGAWVLNTIAQSKIGAEVPLQGHCRGQRGCLPAFELYSSPVSSVPGGCNLCHLFSCSFTFEWWGNNHCCRSIYSSYFTAFHPQIYSLFPNWKLGCLSWTEMTRDTLHLQWTLLVFLKITIGGGELSTEACFIGISAY